MTTAADIVVKLGGKWHGKSGMARCPAHDDGTPSLSITEKNGKVLFHCHAGCDRRSVAAALRRLGLWHSGTRGGRKTEPKRASRIIATYDYRDPAGTLVYQVVRMVPKDFRQRRPDGNGWVWNMEGVKPLPYRLPEIQIADPNEPIFVVEGEKDADNLARIGFTATCNSGGAKKWPPTISKFLAHRNVVILPDNDATGRDHAQDVAKKLWGIASSIRIVELAGLATKGDVSDWVASGGNAEELLRLADAAPEWATIRAPVQIEDFVAYMPQHSYIFRPTREAWARASVNARIPPVIMGNEPVAATVWLDKNAAVEQMTWTPGDPELIRDKLIKDGGWFEHKGARVFNLYRPPSIIPKCGDIAPWLEHLSTVFPEEAEHITQWLAHRVQKPGEKINHALVLGGEQGIGKDTILEPVKQTLGPWNFQEVDPRQALGRFNGHLKAVVLRISEARDLGDIDRYSLYDHLKAVIAAPPDTFRIDEKNIREYVIPNLVGVLVTTNYKGGIYLPSDDRRHFVAWSNLTKGHFSAEYFKRLYKWFEQNGFEAVADYLGTRDISRFDPKAPPPQTEAFWQMVNSNRAPENAQLADAFDALGHPDAVTLEDVKRAVASDLLGWLSEKKNARTIPHRFEECGYEPVRNPDAVADGLWKIAGRRQVIYVRRDLSPEQKLRVARNLKDAR
jgi:hypothetical protein